MPAPLRDVPDQAVELIKAFEGIPDGDPSTANLDAYLCPAGVWTIGWGHALVDNGAQLKGAENKARARALYPGGITRAQAETLLRADLLPRAATVASQVKVALDDGQFGALIALVFNIGGGNLASSTLLRLLNAGDTRGAAEQFLAWDKARVGGVLQPLAGLTRRRRAERALFVGQDWRAAAPTRSRGITLEVLPVPESPDTPVTVQQQPVAPAAVAKTAPKTAPKPAPKTAPITAPGKAAQRAAAKPVAPPAPKKTAAKPRARTTTPTGLPPPLRAKRPAPRTAR